MPDAQPQVIETSDLVASLEDRVHQLTLENVHQGAVLKQQARALQQAAVTMGLLEEQVRGLDAIPVNDPGAAEEPPASNGNRSQRRRQARDAKPS